MKKITVRLSPLDLNREQVTDPQIPPPCFYSSPELKNIALESTLLSFIGKFTILPMTYSFTD